jgi:hypothetical protein
MAVTRLGLAAVSVAALAAAGPGPNASRPFTGAVTRLGLMGTPVATGETATLTPEGSAVVVVSAVFRCWPGASAAMRVLPTLPAE